MEKYREVERHKTGLSVLREEATGRCGTTQGSVPLAERKSTIYYKGSYFLCSECMRKAECLQGSGEKDSLSTLTNKKSSQTQETVEGRAKSEEDYHRLKERMGGDEVKAMRCSVLPSVTASTFIFRFHFHFFLSSDSILSIYFASGGECE